VDEQHRGTRQIVACRSTGQDHGSTFRLPLTILDIG
jgi:hypothetical protein